jgi:hypothetical protein
MSACALPRDCCGGISVSAEGRPIRQSVGVATGAELFDDARLIYQLTKTKVKPEGLVDISDNIGQRFAGQGNRKAKVKTTLE